jgi:uncharacterized damage-inducible protein DinB
MAKKDNLKFIAGLNYSAIKKLIDDVTEEESITGFENINNHIRWQTGHLLTSISAMLRILGEDVSLPDKWVELFSRGRGFNEDSSIYPSMSELRAKLYSLHDKFPEVLEDKTDAFLDEEIEVAPGWKEARMNGLLFYGEHTFYHCGQVAIIIRAIGREKPFG